MPSNQNNKKKGLECLFLALLLYFCWYQFQVCERNDQRQIFDTPVFDSVMYKSLSEYSDQK